MAKHLIQAAVAATQIVGRAFVKALRQEIAASQAAAARAGGGKSGAEHSATNAKLGMTLDEAKQILNVKELMPEDIQKNYEYLFKINDKSQSGSLYLQSKMMAVGDLLLPKTCALSSARGPRWSSLSVDDVPGRRLPAAVMASHLAAPRKAAAALLCSHFSCPFNHTQHCYTYMTNSYQSIRLLSTTSNLSKELTFETVLSKENRLRCVETMAKISSPRVATKPTTVKLAPDTKADTKKHVTDSPSKPRKQSSILVPMCHVSGEICLLYTVRSTKLRSHKGEVSFPGGMEDPCDEANPIQTALREAHEEVGLDPSLMDVWGQVPPIPSSLGDSKITGVLAYIGEINPEELQLNSQEVSEAFVISLKHLCDPEYFRQTQFRSLHMRGGSYTIPVFLGGPYKVWGVTAIFTHMAMRALLPGLYKHNLKHIPPL